MLAQFFTFVGGLCDAKSLKQSSHESRPLWILDSSKANGVDSGEYGKVLFSKEALHSTECTGLVIEMKHSRAFPRAANFNGKFGTCEDARLFRA